MSRLYARTTDGVGPLLGRFEDRFAADQLLSG
jgi:hypothetical protein